MTPAPQERPVRKVSIVLGDNSSILSDESNTSNKRRRVSDDAIQVRRTKKERKLRNERVFSGGKWSKEERLNFLRGLRKFGHGKWKQIQTILTTRSTIQIKSHGQKVLQRIQAGEDVYWELDLADNTDKFQARKAGRNSTRMIPAKVSESDEEDDDTASTLSEVTWNDGKNPGVSESTVAPASRNKENQIDRVVDKKTMPGIGIAAAKPMATKSLPALSISEATVVMALCELANPVHVNTRVSATASKYATNVPFKVQL
ncbi:expressed unknown protein [Seminavis robusta]|uniref:Uncharacterized protein n=1 Tax=Seminavis robusta TaxID=568900 RepID=A0A9N8H8L1_9STRA|nr:expressed unknown protein [Seminavis robusta]|eukprot:Sro94_g048900.1 n/a (259) ;mRNA; f:31865-32769